MKKKILMTMLPLFFWGMCTAQENIVSAGGTASGSGGTVTFTVGQVADQYQASDSRSVLEGVQQPYEIQTVGIDNYPDITLQAMIYPNPTTRLVQLAIKGEELFKEEMSAVLYDNSGKLLQKKTITESLTSFDLSGYATSVYRLCVLRDGQTMKTFQIVKQNF